MSKTAKIFTTIVVVLLLLLAAAEFGTRWLVGRDLNEKFHAQAKAEGVQLSEDPSISFGASPVLLGYLRGELGHIAVTTPSTLRVEDGVASGNPAADISMKGVDISDRHDPVAAELEATAELSNQFLLALLQSNIGGAPAEPGDLGASLIRNLVQVTAVTSHPDTQTISVEFSNGAGSLDLRPVAAEGRTTFEVSNTQVLGFDLPPSVTQEITRQLQQGVEEQLIASGGLSITQAEVTGEGLRATVAGQDVHVSEVHTP
ncbi:LmeA family phospholipid-binding protein [Corynebacterium mastitidis]